MKGLFGYSGDILDSAADHFVFFEELSEKGYFGLSEFRDLTYISVRVVAVVDFSQGVFETGLLIQHGLNFALIIYRKKYRLYL